ncbi:nucleotide-diphospho-sugar transferase [Daedaleopsis nitida]|nr:nucleotide-diphospho-sugar transferase [Daedaleopsis nitida]
MADVPRRFVWYALAGLALLVFIHFKVMSYIDHRRHQRLASPVDHFQDLNPEPIVNEDFLRTLPAVDPSENAIVTSMYTDAYALPVLTLGHSLNVVNSTARRILFYLPGQVSQRALCIASASGFEPYRVERIAPPAHGGKVHDHFVDQYTKLAIWTLGELGVRAVVYLDADTLARRNFDELFRLPFNFAAVPDVYLDDAHGFTIAFNAGVLFVRPSASAFRALVGQMDGADYPRTEAEQAFLNVFHGPDAVRLPYVYNANTAIKLRNPRLWASMQPEIRIIHYTLGKPFWRGVYNEIGLEDMDATVRRRAKTEWGGKFEEEILGWGQAWRDTEEAYRARIAECGWSSTARSP